MLQKWFTVMGVCRAVLLTKFYLYSEIKKYQKLNN